MSNNKKLEAARKALVEAARNYKELYDANVSNKWQRVTLLDCPSGLAIVVRDLDGEWTKRN